MIDDNDNSNNSNSLTSPLSSRSSLIDGNLSWLYNSILVQPWRYFSRYTTSLYFILLLPSIPVTLVHLNLKLDAFPK